MKTGIVCYNHFDATISLGKFLKQNNPGSNVHFIFLLSQSFLDVEIFNLEGKGLNNGFVDRNKLLDVVDQEVFSYLNNGVTFDVFIFNTYKIADLKNFKLLLNLKAFIERENFDILHCVGNNPWIVFLNFLSRKKTPVLHTLHEPYPFSKHSKYRILRHKLKARLLIYSSSHIILPSVTSYNRFIDNFKIKSNHVSIIPFGPLEIYRAYSSQGIKKQDNVVLYYGNISSYKGIEVLLSAMQLIANDKNRLKLIIAGEGSFSYSIPPAIVDMQLINRHLSNKEIADLNEIATVVVCPYLSASQSGVVMTSFAFDNPVIATNVGALPEFVDDNVTGIIIEPNNPVMLSNTIKYLFENLNTIEKMRANINLKYSASKKSWTHIAQQTYLLYEQLLKDKDRATENV